MEYERDQALADEAWKNYSDCCKQIRHSIASLIFCAFCAIAMLAQDAGMFITGLIIPVIMIVNTMRVNKRCADTFFKLYLKHDSEEVEEEEAV